jgi:hypothetical protein
VFCYVEFISFNLHSHQRIIRLLLFYLTIFDWWATFFNVKFHIFAKNEINMNILSQYFIYFWEKNHQIMNILGQFIKCLSWLAWVVMLCYFIWTSYNNRSSFIAKSLLGCSVIMPQQKIQEKITLLEF